MTKAKSAWSYYVTQPYVVVTISIFKRLTLTQAENWPRQYFQGQGDIPEGQMPSMLKDAMWHHFMW